MPPAHPGGGPAFGLEPPMQDETYTVTEQAPQLAADLLDQRDSWADLLHRAEMAGVL